MKFWSKNKHHSAELDEYERAMIKDSENPDHWFWLCVSSGLITLVWIITLVVVD